MLKRTGISYGFDKAITTNGKTEIQLNMAKNEAESCVISFSMDEYVGGVYLDIESDDDFLIETDREFFTNCNGILWPDALVPFTKADVKKAELINLLVRFTSNKNTKAGMHKIKMVLKNAKEEFFTYTVNINVWDFCLPEEYQVKCSMNIHQESIYRLHGVCLEEDKRELYKKYYEYMLKFRISPFNPPYDLLDDRADEYLSDPRLSCFIVDDERTFDDEKLSKIYEKLSKNPEWLKKAILYPFDEAITKEHLDTFLDGCKRLNKLCPNIKKTSAFYKDIKYSEEQDEVQVLIDNCQVVLPKLTCYDDEFIYDEPQLQLKEKYGSFKDRMDKAQQEGKEIWQYVCWEPAKPYLNMYVDEPGLDHRILLWQQHLVGATGFLYWCTTFWNWIDSPWNTMATVPDLSENIYGDGSMLYNGNQVGIDGPCGSVRMEAVRDGLEDCEMFLLADKYLGRDWVLEKIKQVTTDLKTYTDSVSVFVKTREEIGNALEKAIKKQA